MIQSNFWFVTVENYNLQLPFLNGSGINKNTRTHGISCLTYFQEKSH